MLFLIQHSDSPRKRRLVVHYDWLKSHVSLPQSEEEEIHVDEDSEPEPHEIDLEPLSLIMVMRVQSPLLTAEPVEARPIRHRKKPVWFGQNIYDT